MGIYEHIRIASHSVRSTQVVRKSVSNVRTSKLEATARAVRGRFAAIPTILKNVSPSGGGGCRRQSSWRNSPWRKLADAKCRAAHRAQCFLQ